MDLTLEKILRAHVSFVQTLLDERASVATEGRRPSGKPKLQSQSQPEQMPLGLAPEKIVDLIDRRFSHLLEQGEAATAWLPHDEVVRRQERVGGSYRPDGDYADGQAGPAMPWIAPR